MAWRSMANWRPGSAEIEALRGRRVRARAAIPALSQFMGREAPFGSPIAVKAGAQGFVAASHNMGVVVALPHAPPGPNDSIDRLRHGAFASAWMNLATFLTQFELDG